MRVDNGHEQAVALKEIRKPGLLHAHGHKRLYAREVNMLRSLEHPNVISFVDAFGGIESDFLVMELMEGGNLDCLVRTWRAGPLGESSFDICNGTDK